MYVSCIDIPVAASGVLVIVALSVCLVLIVGGLITFERQVRATKKELSSAELLHGIEDTGATAIAQRLSLSNDPVPGPNLAAHGSIQTDSLQAPLLKPHANHPDTPPGAAMASAGRARDGFNISNLQFRATRWRWIGLLGFQFLSLCLGITRSIFSHAHLSPDRAINIQVSGDTGSVYMDADGGTCVPCSHVIAITIRCILFSFVQSYHIISFHIGWSSGAADRISGRVSGDGCRYNHRAAVRGCVAAAKDLEICSTTEQAH